MNEWSIPFQLSLAESIVKVVYSFIWIVAVYLPLVRRVYEWVNSNIVKQIFQLPCF